MSDPFIPNSYYCYHVDSSTGRKYLRYFINETQYLIDCYIEPDGRRIKTWGAGENVSPKQGQWLPSMERFESSQEGDWDNARDTLNAKSEGNFDPDPDNTQPSARTEQSSIATIEHPRAALSLQWYVNSHQGARRLNNQITPLINGQNTFGAVAKAIKEAKQTIEIITWGFDASLRLERPNGKRIGELLEEKGKEGVKVKLLVWRNPLTQVMENTVPGINEKTNTSTIKDAVVWAKHKILPPKITPSPEQLQAEKELLDAKKKHRLLKFDYLTSKASEWINPFDNSDSSSSDQKKRELDELEAKIKRLEQQYAHAQTLPVTTEQVDYGQGMVEKLINSAGAPGDPDSLLFNRDWHHRMSEGEIENVDFRVRDYTSDERSAIALNNIWENVLKKYQPTPALQLFLLSAFPSHHQKTVVVDYEQPKDAIGFVMGHNMHNNYWDTSAHDYEDAKGLRVRGFGPWQDLSCQVKGAVLHDLNRNFCAAWDRGSSWYRRWFDSISDARKSLTPDVFASQDGGMRTVAQITRTQFQEGKERSIRESYMQAMGNARDCIYIENQYFRYKPLAQRLKQTRLQLLSGGKDEAAHGTCHVFIITNVTDDHGRTNTYDMLEALGHWKAMQNVQILYYQSLTTHPAPALRVTELNEKLIALGAAIGYYNMANNLETGYGVKQDKKAALAYYRKSADLGSPDGQAYVGEKMVFDFKKRDLGRSMLECAIAQGSPIAARTLGLFHQLVSYNFSEMLSAMQKAVSLGDYLSALGLEEIFKSGKTGIPEHSLIEIDLKRAERYKRIYSTIKHDPRIRIPEINSIVPLPPAPLPEWDGSFSFQRQPSAQ